MNTNSITYTFTLLVLLATLLITGNSCRKKLDDSEPRIYGPVFQETYSGSSNDFFYDPFIRYGVLFSLREDINAEEINQNWTGNGQVNEYSVSQFGPFSLDEPSPSLTGPAPKLNCIEYLNKRIKVDVRLTNDLPINMTKGLDIILSITTQSDSSFQVLIHTLQSDLSPDQEFDSTFIIKNMPNIKEAQIEFENYQTDGSNDNINWSENDPNRISWAIGMRKIYVKSVNCKKSFSNDKLKKIFINNKSNKENYNGYLYYYLENNYPFNFEISTYAVDESGNVITKFKDSQTPAQIPAAAINPSSGEILSSIKDTVKMRITPQKAKDIASADDIYIEFDYNTNNVPKDQDGGLIVPVRGVQLKITCVRDLRALQ